MRVPRSKGAVSGLLLVLLGLWGGLIPFIGPYFGLSLGPDEAWTWTEGRLLLSVLPAAAVVLGGLVLLKSATRGTGVVGSWLAIAGGAWFVAGNAISRLWNDGVPQGGTPHGSTEVRVLSELSYYHGLGALILLVAGLALGRFATRSVRDAELAAEEAALADRERRELEDLPVADRPLATERPVTTEPTSTERATTTGRTTSPVAAVPLRTETGTRRPGVRRRLLPRLFDRGRS